MKTKLFQITIENKTNETIRFSYRHPLEILHVQFTTEEREPLPQKKVVAQTLAQAKDEELTDVVLEKGEIYTITGLNPWPMVDWSMVSPKPAYAEFIVTIPEFDEVGSGYISIVGVGFSSQRDFEPIAALLKQPLISPDSTTSVTKRKALKPGEAPGAR